MRHTQFKWRVSTYKFSVTRMFSIGLFLPCADDSGLIAVNLVLWNRAFKVELTWVSRKKLRTQ